MTETAQWAPAYILTTAPADDAGNFYIPSLVPAGDYPLPAGVIRQGPTAEQLAAGKPLKYDYMTSLYVESGEDPTSRMVATLGKQLAQSKVDAATQQKTDDERIAALGKQLAVALAASKTTTPAADSTTAPATDDTKTDDANASKEEA
jgi:hypothetical protein